MTKRTMLLGAAAGLLMMGTTGAAADLYTPGSDSMTNPTIGPAHDWQAAGFGTKNLISVIPADGNYAIVEKTELRLPFRIEAEVTASRWRIKQSYITIGAAPLWSAGQVGVCCGSLVEFDQYNYAHRIDIGAKKHVDMDAWWEADVGDNSLANKARNACRHLRDDLEDKGLKHDEIFAQDRDTKISIGFRYVARVGHKNDNHDIVESGAPSIQWKQSQPTYADIHVRCRKEIIAHVVGQPLPKPKPTGSDDLAMGFQVNQAALAITPKHYEAKCPAKLHLNPTIEATGKGTVKYRFVDQLGNHSQTFQVKFDKSDVKFLDHVIEIDDKNKPKGLGFAAAQSQSGALGLAAPSNPNLIQGYFRVEVFSPHKKLSNVADYSVKCTVKTAGDGKITTAPADPKPGYLVGTATPTKKLADLVIDSVQPSPAVPTKLFVKVTNKGTAASTPTNLKALRWVGNQATARGTLVPAVLPGQSQVVLAELGGTIDGATQLYVRVDDPNRVLESDDGNNSFKVK
jgi:CARDB